MRLYLAHPTIKRKEVREWELGFEARTGIELLNPFYDGDVERQDIKEIDAGKKGIYDRTLDNKHIVEGDLSLIRESDGVLAFVPADTLVIGTIFEITIARREFSKPVYIVAPGSHYSHPWFIYHGCIMFDSFKDFEDYARPLRIAFIGRMGEGKTTAANYLVMNHNFKKYSLADKVKAIASDLFGMKEKDRVLLQKLGTDAIRSVFPTAWLDYLIRRLQFEAPERAVVDDVRFINEAEGLRKEGFIIVRIHREKREAAGLNEITQQHASETEQAVIKADYELDNSGSLGYLYNGLEALLEELSV